MTAIIDWPLAALRPQNALVPYLEQNIASSGSTLTGQERLVASDAGRWRYGFSVPVRNRHQAVAWRALVSLAEGRGNLIRVPVCGGGSSAHGLDMPLASHPSGVRYSNGTRHQGGQGFAQSGLTATVAALAPAGATSARLTLQRPAVLHAGFYFSDGDRLYAVKTATLVSGSTWDVTFLPRLRASLQPATEVGFDRLYCVMRIASEDMLRVERELLRFSQIDIEFIEALR